jgi:hypothetical protein
VGDHHLFGFGVGAGIVRGHRGLRVRRRRWVAGLAGSCGAACCRRPGAARGRPGRLTGRRMVRSGTGGAHSLSGDNSPRLISRGSSATPFHPPAPAAAPTLPALCAAAARTSALKAWRRRASPSRKSIARRASCLPGWR